MDLRFIIHYVKSYVGVFKDIRITREEKRRKSRGVGECLVCRRSIHLAFLFQARFWKGGCKDAYGQHE